MNKQFIRMNKQVVKLVEYKTELNAALKQQQTNLKAMIKKTKSPNAQQIQTMMGYFDKS